MLGVGIIGFGRIGAEHSTWITRSTACRVEAVFDPTPARQAQASDRNFRTVAAFQNIIDDNRVDAVLIATPTAMHVEPALAALAAGKHVMVEKPMAMDLPQARRMVDAAKANRRVLSVFHNRRWDIDYLTAKAAVEAGTFGRIFNVESRLGQWSSCVGPAAREYRPNWRNEAAFGGGAWFDWGSHFIDQLWRLMRPAKPISVFAQLRGNVWTSDCDDFARVLANFDNGAVGLVEINTTTTQPLPRWHIDGSKGSATSPHSPSFDTNAWAQFDFISAENAHSPHRIPLADPGLTETAIWDRFARAAAGNGEPAVSAESVLPTMALLDAARESSRVQRAITVEDWNIIGGAA
jgi:scyllo-inositol 2-dehydrogenase (NADP+)